MELGISMVLSKDNAPVSAADVERGLKAMLPVGSTVGPHEDKGDMITFEVDGSDIILAKMPAPMPWSDLEGPCATSVLWKNVADEVKPHQIHWIVTVRGELDSLEMSTLLSYASASLMAASPAAIGIYWANATLLVPKAIFIEFCTKILPHMPPLDIWVDFRVGRDSEKTSAGFTAGMNALGHMEFETKQSPEPPGELRERFLSLARYVVENGPVINDGDTIGEDADERIRVVYSKSEFGHEGKVMRLVYETASPAKPWWKLW